MRSGTVVFMIFPTLISQHPSSLPADCDSRTEAAHSRLEVLFKRQSSGRGPVCVCWRTDAHVLTLLLRPQLLLLGRSAPSRRGTTGRPGKHRVRWKHRESGRGSSLFGFCWSRWGRTESCCFYLKHPSLSPVRSAAADSGSANGIYRPLGDGPIRARKLHRGDGGREGVLLTWRNALDSLSDSLSCLFPSLSSCSHKLRLKLQILQLE